MPRPEPLPQELRSVPFSTARGRERGLSRKRMLASDLDIPFRGVRVPAAATSDFSARCAAYAERMTRTQCFSHLTAARLWGVPLPERLPTDELHVSALRGTARPRLPGVVGHEIHGGHVQIVERRGFAVTDPTTTWLQLASSLGPRWLVAAADHLVLDPLVPVLGERRPYVSLDELRHAARFFTGRHCRALREAAQRARCGAESPKETFLRLELTASGLPEPELNSEIGVRARGRRIFGDLVYRSARVVVEYDGDQHRTDPVQYRRDIERHDALTEAGWSVIRVGAASPRTGPDSVVARTRRALATSATASSSRHVIPLDGRTGGTA